MVNFGLLAAEIVLLVWGNPANFNGFRVLASLLQRRCSMEANQTLHNVWPLLGLVDYIYIFGGCCSVTEFYQVLKFTLRPPSLVLSCWQRYCTAVEQWARAKLCGIEHSAPPIFGSGATIMLALAHILFFNVFRVTVGRVLPNQTSCSAGSIYVSSRQTAAYVFLSHIVIIAAELG